MPGRLRSAGGVDRPASDSTRATRAGPLRLDVGGVLLGQLIGIPAAGLVADRRGLALPFGAGLTLFAAGLAIAGAAPEMVVVVLARQLQGIGGGTIPAIAYVAAGRAYPPELRPRVFAIMSSAWALPGLIGPSISAAVTIQLGWRGSSSASCR